MCESLNALHRIGICIQAGALSSSSRRFAAAILSISTTVSPLPGTFEQQQQQRLVWIRPSCSDSLGEFFAPHSTWAYGYGRLIYAIVYVNMITKYRCTTRVRLQWMHAEYARCWLATKMSNGQSVVNWPKELWRDPPWGDKGGRPPGLISPSGCPDPTASGFHYRWSYGTKKSKDQTRFPGISQKWPPMKRCGSAPFGSIRRLLL